MIGDVFVIVGTVVQASSFSVPQIILARVICVSLENSDLRGIL
jgi:hypothetical protein